MVAARKLRPIDPIGILAIRSPAGNPRHRKNSAGGVRPFMDVLSRELDSLCEIATEGIATHTKEARHPRNKGESPNQ